MTFDQKPFCTFPTFQPDVTETSPKEISFPDYLAKSMQEFLRNLENYSPAKNLANSLKSLSSYLPQVGSKTKRGTQSKQAKYLRLQFLLLWWETARLISISKAVSLRAFTSQKDPCMIGNTNLLLTKSIYIRTTGRSHEKKLRWTYPKNLFPFPITGHLRFAGVQQPNSI